MNDLNEWLKERRETRRGADGQLTATSGNHGNGVFHLDGWPVAAGGGVSRAIMDAHNTLPVLLTAIEKVLELHRPEPAIWGDWQECADCCNAEGDGHVRYPCATVEAIGGAINE